MRGLTPQEAALLRTTFGAEDPNCEYASAEDLEILSQLEALGRIQWRPSLIREGVLVACPTELGRLALRLHKRPTSG